MANYQDLFAKMLETHYSVTSVEYFAQQIRDAVKHGSASWTELGFTDSDVAERLRQAKVREAQENFVKMSKTSYSGDTVRALAQSIRSLVESKETTWTELGFTDSDVAERLQKGKDRKPI